jgi:uncharacterized damage-inducible protein DinB
MKNKDALFMFSLPGYAPEIGRWLWCLEDVRHNLATRLAGTPQSGLDYKPANGHTIGTLLYHIAFVEAGWLYGEVIGSEELPPEISALFPAEGWTEGKLTPFKGESLEEHLTRLRTVREALLTHFQTMTAEDWRTPRALEEYDVTPEWVIYHLIEHEAHHRGQIFQLHSELVPNYK